MRALVTGGAGFIGSALVDRLLAEGHAVDVIDDLSAGSLANLAEARAASRALRFTRHDCAEAETVELIGRLAPEVVFHLAIPPGARRSLEHPAADAQAVLGGALSVLEGARVARAAKLVVAFGAADFYGSLRDRELPVGETTRGELASGRGATLRALLGHLEIARARDALEFSALAIGAVYGPRESAGSQAGVAAAIAAHREQRPLSAGARPASIGDYVYVDDVVDALSRAASRGSGLLLNIGTGVGTSRADLLGLVAAACRAAPVPILRRDDPSEVERCILDASRAAIHLGWRPWTTLAEGVAASLAWYERTSERPSVR